MLPPPLTGPLPSRRLRRTRWRIPWLAIVGILLVVAGVIGAIVWVGALSPYGFIRFPLSRADRTITISRPGTYLVFEEYAGAARSDLPSRLDIAVNDGNGRSLADALLEPGERGAPFAYNVPPNEGRAVARFVAPRPGRYFLRIETPDDEAVDAARYRDHLPDGIAVGRELGMAWLRTPLGLVLFGLLPLAAGGVVMARVVVRRRQRATGPPGRPSDVVR